MRQLARAASPGKAHLALGLHCRVAALAPLPMLLVLATGIPLMVTRWGARPWLVGGIVGAVLLALVGRNGGRLAAPHLAALSAESPLPAASTHAAVRVLCLSLGLRVALGVGIVALMALKPGAALAWGILLAVVPFGVAAGSLVERSCLRSLRDDAPRGIAAGAMHPGASFRVPSLSFARQDAPSPAVPSSQEADAALRLRRSLLALLLLTSLHHVYGAYIYRTPWRLHVLLFAAPAALIILVAGPLAARRPPGRGRATARAALVLTTGGVVVLPSAASRASTTTC